MGTNEKKIAHSPVCMQLSLVSFSSYHGSLPVFLQPSKISVGGKFD